MRHLREVPHFFLGLPPLGEDADQKTVAVIVLAPKFKRHQRKISRKNSCSACQEWASASAL